MPASAGSAGFGLAEAFGTCWGSFAAFVVGEVTKGEAAECGNVGPGLGTGDGSALVDVATWGEDEVACWKCVSDCAQTPMRAL